MEGAGWANSGVRSAALGQTGAEQKSRGQPRSFWNTTVSSRSALKRGCFASLFCLFFHSFGHAAIVRPALHFPLNSLALIARPKARNSGNITTQRYFRWFLPLNSSGCNFDVFSFKCRTTVLPKS